MNGCDYGVVGVVEQSVAELAVKAGAVRTPQDRRGPVTELRCLVIARRSVVEARS